MPADADTPYDVVVLGGGSGGYACALRAAELGLSVALVEKGKLGGTCLHNGCIPTKALLHAAEVADSAREGSRFGIKTTFESVDMSGVHAYKDGVVGRLYKGLQGLVSSRSIEFVQGTGRLGGPDTVDVDGRRITGRNVVLATGSYAKSLPGLEIGGRIMTSDQALTHRPRPGSGGRPGRWGDRRRVRVGVPLVRLGGDHRRGAAAAGRGRGRGHLEPAAARLPQTRHRLPHRCPVRRSAAGGRRRDRGARGRRPPSRRTCSSSPSAAVRARTGSATRRPVSPSSAASCPTDERLRTNVPNVYAVGDIVPGLQLAHRGFAHGDLRGRGDRRPLPAPVEDRGIPRVTYCDPEIASVGLTETQAREAVRGGRDLRVQPRRQRQVPDPPDAGVRRSSSARRTARSSGCT